MTYISSKLRLIVLALVAAALACAGLGAGVASAGGFNEYGIESFVAKESTSRAGMHPDFTTKLVFNHTTEEEIMYAKGLTETVSVTLPPGLIGDPGNMPLCSTGDFQHQNCPLDSQVGMVRLRLNESPEEFPPSIAPEEWPPVIQPLYVLQPPNHEMPARLGFWGGPVLPVFLDVSVRTGGDYGVTATARALPAAERIVSATTEIWGEPANPVHNPQRMKIIEAEHCTELGEPGIACLAPGKERPSGLSPSLPFMSNPVGCGSLQLEATAKSYNLPGIFRQDALMSPITGCGSVLFQPSLTVVPSSRVAGAPTGLSAVLRIPQTNDVNLPASSPLKDAKVTLPEGMTISSAAADGLEGCSAAQAGYAPPVSIQAEEASPPMDAKCPEGAKIGLATIVSPDLAQPLHGGIYQRAQGEAPYLNAGEPGQLLGIWLVVDELGLHIKIPGVIQADPTTGRLTTTFSNTPQVPVEEIDLEFKSGPRAPLRNPEACGEYKTEYELTPWSGNPPVRGQAVMSITEGCGAPGFAPTLSAGTTSPVAGGFSPFQFTLQQASGEQNLSQLEATLPPGLVAKLAGVPLCSEPQAASGECPAGSQIGSVLAATGPGTSPLWLPQPGKSPTAVYLGGPYEGAPLSLIVKTPAQAGPFDLGNVIVRATIRIDPNTAQVSVKTDPVPQIIQGIPIQYRTIQVLLDKSGFVLNPTNCEPMSVNATVTSVKGAVAALSNRFQVGDCASLPFKPAMVISTQGKTSKANGASLTVKLVQKPGEANIHKVDLTLPKALPARLTTLQKACTETQFATNPAGCPPGSFIGTAKAFTPILSVPLTGPAILVSHGGAAFPDVVFLLQANERGADIRIDLDGKTEIKKGITYSRFETVPDAPISSFETNLPQGPHSVLAANANLCTTKPTTPTQLTGQNGTTINQNTKVTVTGCPKTKTLTRAQKLALALKTCHKKPKGAKRASCERQARKKYAPIKKKAKKK